MINLTDYDTYMYHRRQQKSAKIIEIPKDNKIHNLVNRNFRHMFCNYCELPNFFNKNYEEKSSKTI